MKGHIDTGTLAAFREGLLSRRRTARVAAHVSGCPQCAETDARLAGVTTILATSAVPPMPAGLADRIGAALAAEARHLSPDGHTDGAGRGRGSDGPPASSPAPRGAGRGTRGRSWVTLRVAAVTAAVAVIVGGGYGVAHLVSHGVTSGASSSAASGAGHRAASRQPGSAGAAARMPSAGPAGRLNVVHSGTKYQPQQLRLQAKVVLARYGPARQAEGTKGEPAPSFGNDFVSLPGCVRRVSGGLTPRLVDLATYQGRQAAVIMLPAGQNRLRVLVVGTGCSASASDVLARTSVPGTG